ncbi:MAG: DHA2 family efflux MFS transporter permease subunit [Chloroflexi bacterium]|nr:DHA2 family efflux MFS transporter permease subunit [Chloroflexota bacterium]
MTARTLQQDRAGSRVGPGISTRQAYVSFAIVSLAFLMASIDSTIVAVSLPNMLDDLKTNLAWVGWTLTGYQFSASIAMPIVGKISDEFGRKRLFLAAVVIFTISSLAAGLAPNIYWLIAFRFLQGVGGGAFMPSATGIVCDAFGERRASAVGFFNSIYPIGGILGPNIGGLIVGHFSWRWIFFVNVPIGAALFVFGTMLLPKSNVLPPDRRADIVGAGLFSGGVLALLYGMTNWAEHPGSIGTTTVAMFATGILLLFIFARHEVRAQHPIVDIGLLRSRPFLAANVYNFLFGAAIFSVLSFIPYYAVVGYGLTTEESGLLLTPRSLVMIPAAVLTSLFITRLRYRLPMIIGLVTISGGLALLSRGYHDPVVFGLGMSNMVLLALLVAINGLGMGIASPASNNAALDLMPDKVAAASGLRGMFRSVGGAFGTTILILVLSHFEDKAQGMQTVFLYFAALLLLPILIVFLIPDMEREKGNHRKDVPQ